MLDWEKYQVMIGKKLRSNNTLMRKISSSDWEKLLIILYWETFHVMLSWDKLKLLMLDWNILSLAKARKNLKIFPQHLLSFNQRFLIKNK